MSTYVDSHIWDYFTGGRRGVRERICKGVLTFLETGLPKDERALEKLVGLPAGVLQKIRDGVELNGQLSAAAVQRLVACCRLDMGQYFEVIPLSPEEKAKIIAAADQERFIAVAATGDPAWSQDDRIELFLMTTALRQLDNAAGS